LNTFDFTKSTESWFLRKKDEERLLYVEAFGSGEGININDFIVYPFNERLVKYMVVSIKYEDTYAFELVMIFVEFIQN